jgi:hypothetical protein
MFGLPTERSLTSVKRGRAKYREATAVSGVKGKE